MTSKPKLTVQKKVTLAAMKGRPGSLSVPSFSFRFNPTADEDDGGSLEEICELQTERGDDVENTDKHRKSKDEESTESERSFLKSFLSSETPSPPPSPLQTAKNGSPIGGSKLAKKASTRALSLDGNSTPEGGSTDTWSLLSEIKGKIARHVEEKFRFDNILKKDVQVDKPPGSAPISDLSETAIEAKEDEQQALTRSPADLTEDNGESSSDDSVDGIPRRIPEEDFDASELRQRRPISGDEISFSRLLTSRSDSLEDSFTGSLTSSDEVSSATPPPPVYESELQPQSALPKCESVSVLAMIRQTVTSRTYRKPIVFIIFLLVLYQIFLLPVFLSGFLTGCCVVFASVYAWNRLTAPRKRVEDGTDFVHEFPLSPPPTDREIPGVRKVWMNEWMAEYSPKDYHMSRTQSVMVRLDGSTLRLSYPHGKIPKRAMWNETITESSFIYQRLCEISGASITLMPDGLARKRHWSRRFPICIKLMKCPRESVSPPPHLVKDREDIILLFARSGREKEEWFRRFEMASGQKLSRLVDAEAFSGRERGHERFFLDYGVYMARLLPSPLRETSPPVEKSIPALTSLLTSSKKDALSDSSGSGSSTPTKAAENVAWLNALLGRCFWDFMREKEWSMRVSDKIQRKLSMIKVPFMEELRITDIELGSHLPQIIGFLSPVLDERGLWIDANVSYYGPFRMTLETKLNLLKLKDQGKGTEAAETGIDCSSSSFQADKEANRSSYIYDSEAEESVESSSDEEVFSGEAETAASEETGGKTGRKILRFVDSIAQSKYFQNVTDYKFVKKAMAGVSNTPLILTVELLRLDGTLVINIPPPPTDRLWYGFRGNPSLTLTAKPKVGEREVQISHIVEWIEKKLILEFQRILVLPNMDDFVIPLMSSGFSHFGSPHDQSPHTPKCGWEK